MHKILIVDDEQPIVEILSESLRYSGYKCLSANSVSEAKKVLNEHSDIEIILSDIVMPEENGKDLVEWVKKSEFSSIDIILMTGFSSEDRGDLYKLGVETIISKPFDIDQLTLTLANRGSNRTFSDA
jgi:DNA-binding NtrC family response regulator